MPKRLMNCIKAVEARGGPSAKYAWAICVKTTGLHPYKYELKHKRKSKSSKSKGGR